MPLPVVRRAHRLFSTWLVKALGVRQDCRRGGLGKYIVQLLATKRLDAGVETVYVQADLHALTFSCLENLQACVVFS